MHEKAGNLHVPKMKTYSVYNSTIPNLSLRWKEPWKKVSFSTASGLLEQILHSIWYASLKKAPTILRLPSCACKATFPTFFALCSVPRWNQGIYHLRYILHTKTAHSYKQKATYKQGANRKFFARKISQKWLGNTMFIQATSIGKKI